MTRVEFSDTASSTPPLLPLRANAPSPDELITSVPVPPVAWIVPEFDSLLARLPITRSTPLPASVLPLKMSRSISIWLVLLAMSKSPPLLMSIRSVLNNRPSVPPESTMILAFQPIMFVTPVVPNAFTISRCVLVLTLGPVLISRPLIDWVSADNVILSLVLTMTSSEVVGSLARLQLLSLVQSLPPKKGVQVLMTPRT